MKHICSICGYIYDDSKEKIPFNELPDTWKCPLCGAPKSQFKLLEDKPAEEVKPKVSVKDIKFTKLNPGQLSTICSNLARGCEKQYLTDEAEKYREISRYLDGITTAVTDATVDKVLSLLNKDVDNYSYVRSVADSNKDRGAARICVWGEKVTRMLSSLVDAYTKNGDEYFANNNIWLCTVCGFVFVGENPPEICPVCKVPSWKFEKIEGSVD